MPFINEFTRLEQFLPDAKFDQERDLIRVRFETQQLFVSLLGNQWGVSLGDPTLAPSMTENMLREPVNFMKVTGIRVDKSEIGSVALFSLLGLTYKNTWKSQEPITELSPIRRTARLKNSTVILLKNR